MKISIITPIYNGNRYLNKYIKNISNACKNIDEVEVIWVNDSPEIKLEYNNDFIENFELTVINNEKNSGIHASRIAGLLKASGKYILFLDQDDEITENALKTQYEIAETGADFVLGNGIYETENSKDKIFFNKFSQNFATKKRPYLMARNFIISPGQCLIRKDIIPEDWLNKAQKVNGADDYLLWLLLLNNKIKFKCNYDIVYVHKYTGENVSLNKDKMFESQQELLKILENNANYNKKDFKLLKRTCMYKYFYKKEFFKYTIRNIDIFLYNVWYRMVWKGYVPKWHIN